MAVTIVTTKIMNTTPIDLISFLNRRVPSFHTFGECAGIHFEVTRGWPKGHVATRSDIVASLKIARDSSRISYTHMTNKWKDPRNWGQRRPHYWEWKVTVRGCGWHFAVIVDRCAKCLRANFFFWKSRKKGICWNDRFSSCSFLPLFKLQVPIVAQ